MESQTPQADPPTPDTAPADKPEPTAKEVAANTAAMCAALLADQSELKENFTRQERRQVRRHGVHCAVYVLTSGVLVGLLVLTALGDGDWLLVIAAAILALGVRMEVAAVQASLDQLRLRALIFDVVLAQTLSKATGVRVALVEAPQERRSEDAEKTAP